MRVILCMLIVLMGVGVSRAQEITPEPEPVTCPDVVQTALRLTTERCEDTGVNRICYGHLVLDAQPRSGLSPFDFGEPGDQVDVVSVQSLRLSAMDTLSGQWGVVIMQVEANTDAADIAGDGVQIVLFGDVALDDATPFLAAEAIDAANIRSFPDGPVIDSLAAGDTVTVNGRLEDGSWLRVRLSQPESGWIFADLLALSGAADGLIAFSAEEAREGTRDDLARYGPMQAFYVASGSDDSPCPEAPDSGLLIQTPEGMASVSLWMDEVVIDLNGTAAISAQAGGDLTLSVLDGAASVTAAGETRAVGAGGQISVPLDADLAAAGVPGAPRPYAPDAAASLPLGLLDDPITAAPPLAEGRPLDGDWRFSWGVESLACPDGTDVPFISGAVAGTLTTQNESLLWGGVTYQQTTPGVYSATYADADGNLHQDTLLVIAPDRIEGEKVLDLLSPVCTLYVPFRLDYSGP